MGVDILADQRYIVRHAQGQGALSPKDGARYEGTWKIHWGSKGSWNHVDFVSEEGSYDIAHAVFRSEPTKMRLDFTVGSANYIKSNSGM